MADKSKNWFARHKVLTVILALVVLGSIAGAAGGNKSNTDSVKSSNSDTSATTPADKTATPAPAATEKLTISNSVYTSDSGLNQVTGEVKNNDSGKHSATLKATFYDAAGKITGTASGAVNDVAPGETKTFTLLSTTDVTGYANMKVQVDTLL
jgi:hypothetical protein